MLLLRWVNELGGWPGKISEQMSFRLKPFKTKSWTPGPQSSVWISTLTTADVPALDLSLSPGLMNLNTITWSFISFSFMKAFSFYLCFLRQAFHFPDRCCVILQQPVLLSFYEGYFLLHIFIPTHAFF